MLNRETFEKDILKIEVSGEQLALVKGKPVACCDIECDECEFNIPEWDCKDARIEWLNRYVL